MFLKFYGVVIEDLGNYEVMVVLGKPKAAGGTLSKEEAAKKMKVVAKNYPGAKVGQTVSLQLKKQINKEEVFVSYILPTASFFAGFFLTLLFTENSEENVLPYLVGGIMLFAALIFYWVRRKNYKAVYKGKIKKIVDPEYVRKIHLLEEKKKKTKKNQK